MAALDAPLFKIPPSQWDDDKLIFALGWEAKNEHVALTEVDRYRCVLRRIAIQKEIRRRMAPRPKRFLEKIMTFMETNPV